MWHLLINRGAKYDRVLGRICGLFNAILRQTVHIVAVVALYFDLLEFSDCPIDVVLYPSSEVLAPYTVVNCTADGYPEPSYSLAVIGPTGNRTIDGPSMTLSEQGIYNITCNATTYITSGQQGDYYCSNQSVPSIYNVTYAGFTFRLSRTTFPMRSLPNTISFMLLLSCHSS
jgi:hypothetical protein